MNPHKITAEFEKSLCDYCGSPYAVAVDNCSNALFLALTYFKLFLNKETDTFNVWIPSHTYPAVPCEIIHAGFGVAFSKSEPLLRGEYPLEHTPVWDSALRFTSGMYRPGQFQCLSFTGPFKHLKLGKGGAILTDDINAYYWFKRARFSGRQECSYHDDDFDGAIQKDTDGYDIAKVPPVVGWNFYMMPEIAARGLLLMAQFYDKDGKPKSNEDLCLPYPDLSKYQLWK